MPHRFHPQHADRLLSEERLKMISPHQVIDHLQIVSGHIVADVGVGPGFFAIPIAKRTNQLVYGIDVESQMLSKLRERASVEQVQIEAIEASAEQIPLSDHQVDRTLCAFVLHEVDDPINALQEFWRITKKEGYIGIVEWEKKATKHGPPISERLSREELDSMLDKAQLELREWVDLSEDHYLCICRPKK